MKTIYLIDYENVGSDGLLCCDKLSDKDRIVIFFTKNAPKIDMTKISNLKKQMLDMIEVPTGKQSADMYIGSCLGYLMGKYHSKECRIVIISRDTDYDNLIESWNKGALTEKLDDNGLHLFRKKQTVKACRTKKIKSDIAALTPPPPIKSNRKVAKLTDEQKTELYELITETIQKEGFDASVGDGVANLSVALFPHNQFIAEIHNELQNSYKDYLKIYRAIKPILSAYPQKPQTPQNPESVQKVRINSQIMQRLSKAGYSTEIVGYTASTVAKHYDAKNGKQIIYRALISKFGMNNGLEIYRCVKGLLEEIIK